MQLVVIVQQTNHKKLNLTMRKIQEAKELIDELNKISMENEYKNFLCLHSSGKSYDFNEFRNIKQFGNNIFNGHISIEQAKTNQNKMEEKMIKLENYNPISEERVNSKKEVLDNAKELFDTRSRIIKAFEDGISPLPKENLHKEQAEEEEKDETIPNWIKVRNHAFKRIRERVDKYMNKGWHSKVDGKSITNGSVKNLLQNIVNGKFNNAEEVCE